MKLGSSPTRSCKTRDVRALLVLVLSLATAFTASASSQGIDFSFSTFNDSIIQRQGKATYDSSGFIQITEANRDKDYIDNGGWATYYKPMRLWDKATRNVADFTTQFTFVINSQKDSNTGDGMTFFLVPVGSNFQNKSLGGQFAILDISRDPLDSSARFVAVEFDTYGNIDPQDHITRDSTCPQGPQHIGIDLNNLNSTVSECVDWFKDKIMTGGRINATITYNSSTKNLSVLMIDANGTGTDINSSSINSPVDLTEYLPEWVTFGFSAATGVRAELHTIEAWEFRSTVQVADTAKKSKLWLWSVLGSGSFLFLIIVVAFIWLRRSSKRKKTYMSEEDDDLAIDKEFEQVPGPRKFSYKDLVAATENFAIERLLGEGGFGRVYQGYLTTVNANVAIKKINPGSRQGIKEYATEVRTISRLRHRNLVQLIGWCHKKKELLLIYEFMSNGSLDAHLFKDEALFPWEKRYIIALGIASVLLYLHEEWEQCVLHRDIKSSNIMLDADFNAKLGDFGLARLVDHASGLQTTVSAGTMGYMAPEYVYTGKASKESDVYSFGVVLLEIACGRKVIEPRAEEGQAQLVDWVWGLYRTERLLDAVDSKLGSGFDRKQLECLMVVGLWCAQPDHTARPSIREASSVLNFNAPLPVLPSKLSVPAYMAPLSTFSIASIVSSNATSTSGTELSTFTTPSAQPFNSASSALLQNAE